MSEEAELQARIAALSNRISAEKTGAHSYSSARPRWSPYGSTFAPQRHHARGRGGVKPNFRNRTLVNNSNAAETGSDPSDPLTVDRTKKGVVTHDRGRMQWTSATVFDQKVQQKQEAVAETTTAKRQKRDDTQKNRVLDHIYGGDRQSATAPREIVVNDLVFRVATDGSKLIRVYDTTKSDPQSTPREAKIAGVIFVRTKNGNLIRQGLLKNKRTKSGLVLKKLCPDFTSTGSCLHGNRCRFKHDISKLAICKDFLRSGTCAAGEACNLSHEPTSHRIPTCLHFLRDACTKPDCRYSHAQVDPSAPVCKAFARLGYCEKGAMCKDRHVTECPDYANTGSCRDRKCRLPHIDRAGVLRKQAAASAAKHAQSDDAEPDVSSDEGEYDDIDSDDADSEEIEDNDIGSDSNHFKGKHDLDQQMDFVPFR